jgi:hypothetical protein
MRNVLNAIKGLSHAEKRSNDASRSTHGVAEVIPAGTARARGDAQGRGQYADSATPYYVTSTTGVKM